MTGQFARLQTVILVWIGSWFGSVAYGQPCQPHWSDQFGSTAGLGVTGGVGPRAFTLFDADADGPGLPALVVAGAFGTAGGVSTGNVALWNGSAWSGFDGGTGGLVFDVVVFDDDGPGPVAPALYAAGNFRIDAGGVADRIARWNGTTWQSVGAGLNNTAFSLAVFDDDGAGPILPALYVGGEFTSAGGVTVNRLARWNGSSWSDAGAGLPTSIQVKDLLVFDGDGAGPDAPILVAGTDGGGRGVYGWNGQVWSFLGGFIGGGVSAVAGVDHDGPGPDPPTLYAGGDFVYHGGVGPQYVVNFVARHVGGTLWTAMAEGVVGNVRALTSFDDDGSGPNTPALYVAGEFLTASGVTVNHIAKWDGQNWSALDGGITPTYTGIHASAVGVFDQDGPGPRAADLYAGGFFSAAGGVGSENIAAWLGCSVGAPVPGDIDGDGDVDETDRVLFVGVMLGTNLDSDHVGRGDMNGDGVADGKDIGAFVAAFMGG